MVLSGWALEETGASPQRLAVALGGLRFESDSFRRIPRPDLKHRYPMCALECGYEWRIPTSAPLIRSERPPTLQLYAELRDGGWSAPLPHRVGCFGPGVVLLTGEQAMQESLPLDAPSAAAV